MLKNIHQDSILNAFFLSILATAGLFYVNLGGSFLSAFVLVFQGRELYCSPLQSDEELYGMIKNFIEGHDAV